MILAIAEVFLPNETTALLFSLLNSNPNFSRQSAPPYTGFEKLGFLGSENGVGEAHEIHHSRPQQVFEIRVHLHSDTGTHLLLFLFGWGCFRFGIANVLPLLSCLFHVGFEAKCRALFSVFVDLGFAEFTIYLVDRKKGGICSFRNYDPDDIMLIIRTCVLYVLNSLIRTA